MDKSMSIYEDYEVIHIIHNVSLPFPPRTPHPLIATTIAYFPLICVLTMGSTSQSYQTVRQFLKLSGQYTYERFEKSCERALFYKYETAEAVELVLQKRLENLALTYCTDIFGNDR